MYINFEYTIKRQSKQSDNFTLKQTSSELDEVLSLLYSRSIIEKTSQS